MKSEPTPNDNGAEHSLIDSIASRRSALTVEELAQKLSLSRRAVYDLVKSGRLPHLRIGVNIRLDPKTTADWLREQQLTVAN